MIEFNGAYTQQTKINNVRDPNSGGNTFFIGPSLWFSTEHFIIQSGIAFPLSQHLFGKQEKNTYFLSGYIGWKFN